MGVTKRLQEESRAKKANPGKNGRGGSGVLSRLAHVDGPSSEGDASWGDVSDSLIAWLVRTCAGKSGAVLFGLTRDGGALTVRIYDGDATHTEYFGNQADLSMAVWSFCNRIAAEGETLPEE